MKRSLLLIVILLLVSAPAWAQPSPDLASPVGRWVTIDDERNQPRSLVQIYQQGGLLYAKVDSVYLRQGEPQNPTCEKCKDERKDQPILGMTIMWDMKPKGSRWTGGQILDPENGKTYRCRIWVEDGTLKVRGYFGPFYRTQTWHPAE